MVQLKLIIIISVLSLSTYAQIGDYYPFDSVGGKHIGYLKLSLSVTGLNVKLPQSFRTLSSPPNPDDTLISETIGQTLYPLSEIYGVELGYLYGLWSHFFIGAGLQFIWGEISSEGTYIYTGAAPGEWVDRPYCEVDATWIVPKIIMEVPMGNFETHGYPIINASVGIIEVSATNGWWIPTGYPGGKYTTNSIKNLSTIFPLDLGLIINIFGFNLEIGTQLEFMTNTPFGAESGLKNFYPGFFISASPQSRF
jgi:hypothetical protein